MQQRTNWAGNITYSAARWHEPESLTEVPALVAQCESLRVVGTAHSFNTVADSPHDLLSLRRCSRILGIDSARQTVTIEAGVRYGELALYLHERSWALHNLASLPHISVAGAVATGTHGSGNSNGSLATAVVGMELVQADGTRLSVSRETHPDTFDGYVVHLGALGVVTTLTLAIEPAYTIAQTAYERLPIAALATDFEAITGAGYSVSLFTDWQRDTINQVWVKSRGTTPAAFFGATPAPQQRHPLADHPAASCTPQGGVPGPWHERLPHFQLAFTPSSGAELQSEYFVAREHALRAFSTIAALKHRLAPHLMVSEIRTIASDTLWLSPAFGRESVGFHFTWHQHIPEVLALLPTVEAALAPFAPRPHWGKVFTMTPTHYANLPAFAALTRQLDPTGKFRNAFLEAFL